MMFGNRYRAIEKIGSGGMADVYKAMDEVLGRTVAVKVMHAHYADEPTFVARFRHEAQAAGNLSHPNIVNVYDWGQQDGTYYIVMEYIRGTEFKELIRQQGPIDPLKAAEYAAQVCAALSVAHGYGLVHRDIKPQNLVLMADGTVKVMDFGIARAVNSTMTQTGSVLGTAQYISPEQAQGRELGPATDLYSLGIVTYEMTTGRLPFEGDTPVAVALKQVNEHAVPPRQIDPAIPPAVEAVILRAMEKDPARRYSSADEMRADLLRAAQGRAVTATPRVDDTTVMPAVERAQRLNDVRRTPVTQRRGLGPGVWAGVVVLLLVLGVVGAWALGLFDGGGRVPDVANMPLAQATMALEKAGLAVGNVDTKPDDNVPKDNVISTDPAVGTAVARGQTVDLTVSGGPAPVKVPLVIGLTEDDAIAALQQAGLEVELPIVREFNAKADPGTVYEQQPLGNSTAAKGTKIKLLVSKGTEAAAVPYVVDKKKADAIAALQQAGFTVKSADQSSASVAKGIVIDQKPAGGGTAPKGSEIIIYVSTGPEMALVPDVTTMTEADAKAKLNSVGLTWEVNTVAGSPPDKVGKVTGQAPAAGTSVPKGQKVTISVGAA